MRNNMKWISGIRGNLLVMVAIPVFLLGVMGWVSFTSIRSVEGDLFTVVEERLPETELMGEMRTSLHAVARYLWLAHARAGDVAGRKKALDEAHSRKAAFQDALSKFESRNLSEVDQKFGKEIDAQWKKLSPMVETMVNLMEKHKPEADQQARHLMLAEYSAPAAIVADVLRNMAENDKAANAELMAKAKEHSHFANQVMLATTIGGSLLMLVIGFWIASRLASRLGGITESIGSASAQVGSASSQLSEASQKLSSGATESAASLEETVASLEELTSMVKLNADNSKEAAVLAQTTSQSADVGEAEIRKLIEAMADVAKGSKKIEEIINVIDDIAFQTNLLALNAAVEAARAGEQGKGFAVEAEAVRNLAQRSSAAAKDINVLIKDSVNKTEHGAKIADQSGAVLKNIVTSIKKVSELNNEIASASQQQSDGLGQIGKAMNQLDIVTQSNASAAEEAAAASEEMSAQAVTLGEMVNELTVIVEGKGAETSDWQKARPADHKVAMAAPMRSGAQVVPLDSVRRHSVARPVSMEKARAEEVIPFDDADGSKKKKIGTVDGF